MSCNLCHGEASHKETCPMLIRVDWSTDQTSSSVWEVFARELFEEYAETCLYEAGTYWIDFVRAIKRHIEDGQAYEAVKLLRGYRERRLAKGA